MKIDAQGHKCIFTRSSVNQMRFHRLSRYWKSTRKSRKSDFTPTTRAGGMTDDHEVMATALSIGWNERLHPDPLSLSAGWLPCSCFEVQKEVSTLVWQRSWEQDFAVLDRLRRSDPKLWHSSPLRQLSRQYNLERMVEDALGCWRRLHTNGRSAGRKNNTSVMIG